MTSAETDQQPGRAGTDRCPDDYRIALESALGIPFVGGNAVVLLQNGDRIFPAMLDAIEAASDTLEFATYVYWQGDIADEFARAFERAAKRGVRVRLLLDAVGCRPMDSRHVADLEQAGAEVRWFRPLSTFRLWRLDKRTHRKILICDNSTGFTGGVGIAKEWSGNARNSSEWRDTHVRISGPACAGLAAAFRENWNEAGEWEWDIPASAPAPGSDDVLMQVVRSSGRVEWSEMATLIRSLISVAKSSLHIVTAYFAPDPVFVRLAKEALGRGVAIKLLLPGEHTDSRLSQLAGHPAVEELAMCGAEIWHYNKTLLHAKLAVVDGCVSCIGSANLNHRSFGKDEECNVLLLDSQIANSLIDAFDDDCRDADLVDPEQWKQRGIVLRLKERLARTIIEQL